MSGTDEAPARPWEELRTSGLLWLINSVVFHPRGFALALVQEEGVLVGWRLLGDGSEPWRFEGDVDDLFRKAEATLWRAGLPADLRQDGAESAPTGG